MRLESCILYYNVDEMSIRIGDMVSAKDNKPSIIIEILRKEKWEAVTAFYIPLKFIYFQLLYIQIMLECIRGSISPCVESM